MGSWLQLNTIFGNLKWIIITSLLISALLFLPAQVLELYRIAADEGGTHIAIIQFVSTFFIAFVIWLGAIAMAADTFFTALPDRSAGSFGNNLRWFPALILRALPSLVGALPLVAAAIGQFLSRPELQPPGSLQVGTVSRIQQLALTSVYGNLNNFGYIYLGIALCFGVISYVVSARALAIANWINGRYFLRNGFFIANVVIIIGITTAFIAVPVAIPQWMGAFPILLVFVLCITAIGIHLSLVTIRSRVPIIPAIILYALIIAAADWNGDRWMRVIAASDASPDATKTLPLISNAFESWLKQRAAKSTASAGVGSASTEPYPVFIISAQGGGIYAAYNSAIFLSRMEDLCPNFHRHVFAISGVSGGSVGAATFTAALDAAAKSNALPASVTQPCPSITQFLSGAIANNRLDAPGQFELKADQVLSHDFLAPLAAATLFPDFSQWVIPHSFGILDRSRALEYSLESATDGIYQAPKDGTATPNILREGYHDFWKPEGNIPALLLNATDTATGKRVLFSPFMLSRGDDWASDVCVLTPPNKSKIPISTAAFVSARFVWVTPAASTDMVNRCMGQQSIKGTVGKEENKIAKARLVDGGYIDNSGIETALDAIADLNAQKQGIENRVGRSYQIYLISLSGGDFPDIHLYSFGEIAEPIRALLNGREARAYIAVSRARSQLNHPVPGGDQSPEPPVFNLMKLQNNFYSLPLGWAVSQKTREIIALDSGRFWDCAAQTNFIQSDPHASNADCVQLAIYHLLNGSSVKALQELRDASAISEKVRKYEYVANAPTLDHEKLLACYETDWWSKKYTRWLPYLAYYQTTWVRELLNEWERQKAMPQNSRNERLTFDMLAYILGAIAHDSADFRRTTDNLWFSSVEALNNSRWKSDINRINSEKVKLTPPAQPVDIKTLVNNPEGLAEVVWGWEKNIYGNNFRDRNYDPNEKYDPSKYDPSKREGWKYRERGIYQQVGFEQYRDAADLLSREDAKFNNDIDLLKHPDAMANSIVSARVAFARLMYVPSPPLPADSSRDKPLIAQRRKLQLSGKTLGEVLAQYPGNFENARINQTDMWDGEAGAKDVTARALMFRHCIDEASQPAKGVTSAN